MKRNVYLIGPIESFEPDFFELMRKEIPGIEFTNNFEQVYAYAKSGELGNLCVFWDAYNYSKSKLNMLRGQRAAEEIHAIDPTIPVLVWDGREFYGENPEFTPCGDPKPILYENEAYLETQKGMNDITIQFFRGLKKPKYGVLE